MRSSIWIQSQQITESVAPSNNAPSLVRYDRSIAGKTLTLCGLSDRFTVCCRLLTSAQSCFTCSLTRGTEPRVDMQTLPDTIIGWKQDGLENEKSKANGERHSGKERITQSMYWGKERGVIKERIVLS